MAWTTPRTWAAAEFVTETMMNAHVRDNLNYLNDLRVKYGSVTANSSAFSAETDLITAPAFTPISGSRLLRVSYRIRAFTSTNAGDILTLRIKEGSTEFSQQQRNAYTITTAVADGIADFVYIASPSAASHTYKVTGQRTAGTGTFTLQAASNYPTQIIVEDIGAA